MSLSATRQSLAIAIGVSMLIMSIPSLAAQNPPASNMPTSPLRLVQQDLEYTRYVDAKTGTAITYPGSIFSKSDESTDQFTKFISSDRLLAIHQFSRAAQRGGSGRQDRTILTMRRRPLVNQEVRLRATFLG